MRKTIGALVIGAMLAIPGVASAHTASVKVECSKVTFHYNADFPIDTTVTEMVNGVSYTYLVKKNTASDNVVIPTIVNGENNISVSSTWSGGGSLPRQVQTVTCTVTPPVVPVCPDGTVAESQDPLVCVRTVTVTNTVTEYVDRPVEVIKTVIKNHTRIKNHTKIKYRDRWHVRYVQWCKLKPHHTPGVTG